MGMQGKEAEQALMQCRKLILMGKLSHRLAHDYNNMLSAIIGYGDLLVPQLQGAPQLEEYAQNMVQAAKSSMRLIAQVLGFSKRQAMEPQILDIDETIGEIGNLARRLGGDKLKIELNLPGSLAQIKIDSLYIIEIILLLTIIARENLVVKKLIFATSQKQFLQPQHCLLQEEMPAGDYIELQAIGTGQIEEPSKCEKPEYIALYQTFLASQAYLKLDNSEQSGNIKLYFPIVKQACVTPKVKPQPIHKEEKQSLAPQPQQNLQQRQVLVIEDEDLVRTMAVNILTHLGYSCLSADNCQQALEIIEEKHQQISILLVDVLIEGDGREQLNEKIASLQNIEVIYMSGYPLEHLVAQQNLSADVLFLQKPFSLKSITEKMQQAINKLQ